MQGRCFIHVMLFLVLSCYLVKHFATTNAPYSVVMDQVKATWSARKALAAIAAGNTRANSVPQDLPKIKHQAKKLEVELYTDFAQILWRDFTTGYLEAEIPGFDLSARGLSTTMDIRHVMIERGQQSCNAFTKDGSRCTSYECNTLVCPHFGPGAGIETASIRDDPVEGFDLIGVKCSLQQPFNAISVGIGKTDFSCNYYQNWLEVVNDTVTGLIEKRRKTLPIILDEN